MQRQVARKNKGIENSRVSSQELGDRKDLFPTQGWEVDMICT